MKRWLLAGLLGGLLGVGVHAQGPLSDQVLQLLTRVNTWTATNTFLDLRLIAGVPSDTALRFYADASGNLYFNGVLVAGAGGVTNPHNLLSTTHADTAPASVTRGAVIVGNSTPQWSRLALCASGQYVGSNGTDTVCATSAAAFTNLPAAGLTGNLPALNAVALVALNASNLSSGTVPLAQLSGITNTQIAANAAVAYSKLNLAASVNLASDVTGALPLANGGLGLATAANNTVPVSTGSAYVATTVTDCHDGTHALAFTQSTNLFSCQALSVGSGTVTSAAITVPTGLAVSGSPITASGTFAITLSNETANTVWAGPTTGSAAAPTFRALVNGDFPVTGVSAGTYPKVTVNTAGLITSGTSQITLTTDVTGTLPRANGGTGVAVSGTNTVLVGNGTLWVAQTITDCQYGLLAFTQSTNLFSCPTSLAASAAGVGTLGTTALPYASLILGTAATNNLTLTPAALSQATTATVDDPKLAAVKFDAVARGTISYTGASLSTGTCDTVVTATVTGLLGTSVVTASLNAAPGTQWKKGIYWLAYPTANTVNIEVCNPTGGSITPDNATFNYAAVLP